MNSVSRRNGRAAWPVVLALLALSLAPWPSPHGPRPARAAEVLTNQNVIAMVRAGLPESLILSKIQSTEPRFDLSSNGLISLKQGGVSDTIMLAMMNRLTPGSPAASTAPPPAPVYQSPPAPGQPAPPPSYPAAGAPPVQGAPGCPQLAQPDPYQDMRGALAQLRAQAGQPGAQNQGQIQPLVAQVQGALDARDAALRQGQCDTSQYEQQIGSLVASLQSALSASPTASAPPPAYGYPQQGAPPPPASGYQAGAPPGYPQQGSQPPPAGYPQPGVPGASTSQMPSASDIFSKLFDIAVEKFAGKSKKGGDGGSGFSMGNQPPPAYSDPSAGQPGYSSPPPGYAPPPPGYASPPPGYAPPPPGYTSPPPGYTPPPPGYAPPPPGYASPPPGYTPPPPSYAQPPPSYAPPPSYTSPPPSYTPPPSYASPPPSYTPPPSSTLPPSFAQPPPTYTPPPSFVAQPIPQKSTANPQSATLTPAQPPKPFPSSPDMQGLAQVSGTVRGDGGAVIAGAIVSVLEWNKMMSTGSDGNFSFQGPAGQRVTIQVQAYGYITQTIVVAAGPGALTTQNVALAWARRPVGTSGR